jgi:hypothetical protein
MGLPKDSPASFNRHGPPQTEPGDDLPSGPQLQVLEPRDLLPGRRQQCEEFGGCLPQLQDGCVVPRGVYLGGDHLGLTIFHVAGDPPPGGTHLINCQVLDHSSKPTVKIGDTPPQEQAPMKSKK